MAPPKPASEDVSPSKEEPSGAAANPVPHQITLRFLRSHQGYNRGVEAGFAPGQAAALTSLGVAVQIHPPIPRSPAMAGMVRK